MLGEHFVVHNVPPLTTAQSEGLLSELERRSADGFECVDKAFAAIRRAVHEGRLRAVNDAVSLCLTRRCCGAEKVSSEPKANMKAPRFGWTKRCFTIMLATRVFA